RDGNRKTASLYDVIPAGKKVMKETGKWNQGRVLVKDSKVTHYLNGKKTVSYDLKSKEYRDEVQLSKFKDAKPLFVTVEKGYILLQDHQDEVSFRNIKIRDLSKYYMNQFMTHYSIHKQEAISAQVRRDIVRMVHACQSGHPGRSLGCTEYLVALFFEAMNRNQAFHVDGIGEDIFFLSNGHISPVFY